MIKQSLITLAIVTLITDNSLAVDLTKCVGCHGQHFEKPAMNISRIVKDLKREEIYNALKGYQNGSHGGSMQEVMKQQVSAFSEKEIEEIIEIITTRKVDKNIHLNSDKKETLPIEVTNDSCLGCHGVMFEKSAMGYSRIVNQMSKEDIIASLNGYKNGTYGGEMKALMATHATKLSEEEIEAFAKMISNLNPLK